MFHGHDHLGKYNPTKEQKDIETTMRVLVPIFESLKNNKLCNNHRI